jgi:hypothetical protein
MRRKYTSLNDKLKIMTLWKEGMANHYIADTVKLPLRTVQRVVKENWNLPAGTPVAFKKSGRPKKTSPSTDRMLKLRVLSRPSLARSCCLMC